MAAGDQNYPSQAANNYGSDGHSSSGASGYASSHGAGGLPTPASLAELMRSTRQFLIEQAGESLLVCMLPSAFSKFYLDWEMCARDFRKKKKGHLDGAF